MLTNEDSQGVSNCYVFKSRLQEYAQKVGLPTPVYETIKEGPSHQPSFRSTVILKDVRYDSLPGFFNRKAAEQSAAEIALVELAKSDEVNQSITQPVIETGLCKNLLQEYAQKMNYAMPLYLWKKDERPGRSSSYSCTVEIGGIRYIGASAKTKKEAEIKAARTALLAIESSASHSSEKQFGPSKLTVIPCKKRGAETIGKVDETSKVPKTKKMRFKRKLPRKKQEGRNHIESAAYGGAKVESHANVNDESCVQMLESRTLAGKAVNFDNEVPADYQNENGISSGEGLLSLNSSKVLENGESMEVQSNDSCIQTVKYRPLAACDMKFFDNGMLIDCQNEKGMLAGDDSLSLNSNKVFGNGNSTELPSNESSLQIIESKPWAAEGVKIIDIRMPINYQNEKCLLAGGYSLSLNNNSTFAVKKSAELLSNEPCVQTMESVPVAEAMKNFNDGLSLGYRNEKVILAVEGSLSLDSKDIFENRKSTELQSSESCLRIMDSTRPAAEIRKNCDGMLANDQNEKGPLAGEGSLSFADKKSTGLLSNEPCVQSMESIPVAEAMKIFDDGASLDYQNERGIVAVEGSLSLDSNNIFENRKLTELQSSESCLRIMDSTRPAAEIRKNCDGMLANDQNEKGPLAGEGSLSFADKKSTELLSNEHCVLTMESIPVAEGMKFFDDGVSLDYQNEKGTLAVEGSLSLDSNNIFENRKSTELQSSESCLPIMDSIRPAAKIKKNYYGMLVNDQNEKGPWAGEGSLSFADKKSTGLLSSEPCVQTMESIPVAEGMKFFDDGVSLDYQNERGIVAVEGSLSLDSNNIFENRKSTELQSSESCLRIMDSSRPAAEIRKNCDGMLVNDQNEKGPLAGEGSLSFADKKSTELLANEPCVQTMESIPVAEAMKIFDDGVSLDYQNERGIVAVEGSLSLDSNNIFENRKSTELQSSESCLRIMDSTRPAAEIRKNCDGMLANDQNEKGPLAGEGSLSFADKKSTELLANEPCVQTMESIPVAEAMKIFDDGVSLDYQNERGIVAVEGSLSLDSNNIFENRKSTELQSSESCLRIMDSTRPAAEIRKNCDGMLANDQNEKGPLAGEGSLSFADKKSTELLANEPCVQTMESIPVAEAMKIFDDGVSLDYQNERGIVAVEGSLSLDSNNIFENRKSTELQSSESCLRIMDSTRPAAEIRKNCDGMLVNDQNEKGPFAGEGSLSFADKKSTELLSNEPCVQSMESIPVAEAMKIFDDRVSLDYQNERGIVAVEGSLSLDSNNIFENRKSTELQSSESCLRIMDSTRPAAEIRKNCDGMLVNDQNE